jgi:hypothetical protein
VHGAMFHLHADGQIRTRASERERGRLHSRLVAGFGEGVLEAVGQVWTWTSGRFGHGRRAGLDMDIGRWEGRFVILGL